MRLNKVYFVMVVLLVLAACSKKTDWRFTLNKNSTEPFGLYLAYKHLNNIFPTAKVETIYDFQKYFSSKKVTYVKENTLVIAVTQDLQLSKKEAQDVYEYVQDGGVVLLLSNYFSSSIDSIFNIKGKRQSFQYPLRKQDSIQAYSILWDNAWHRFYLDIPFEQDYFLDETAMGFRKVKSNMKANLVSRNIGKGQIVFGNSPELLTNYAMLKEDNKAYYEILLSYYSGSTSYIKWFSAEMVTPKPMQKNNGLLSLLNKKEYRWAFFVLLAIGALLFIFGIKRNQRIVPYIKPITNESLAFTEAIGKLFYSEGDHANLSQKMIKYYLEHIRSTYKISTIKLDTDFAIQLSKKINQPEDKIIQFKNYLNTAMTSSTRSEQEVKTLYKLLKKYK